MVSLLMMMRRAFFVLLLLGASGCRCGGSEKPNEDLATSANFDAESILVPIGKTTTGAIAIGNLNAQIAGQERRDGPLPGDPKIRAGIVDLLITEGDFTGSIKDYEKASDIAEQLVKDWPQRPESWKARASASSLFHRFDAALADLAAAEKAGAPPDSLKSTRSSILAAQGKLDEAWAIAPTNGDPAGKTIALATRANLEGQRGDLKAAEDDFAAARKSYADVSAFPMAWMDNLEATLFEKNGDKAKARAYFTRAVRILPSYARAASHLANYETAEKAVAILAPIAQTSDDPEVHAAYGDALRRVKREADSVAEIAKAKAGYEALLAKHPEAFSDHAARFYLGAGADPKKALELAAANAKNRSTDEALSLWLEAAQATNAAAAACSAANALVALPHAAEPLRAAGKTAAARCGK